MCDVFLRGTHSRLFPQHVVIRDSSPEAAMMRSQHNMPRLLAGAQSGGQERKRRKERDP